MQPKPFILQFATEGKCEKKYYHKECSDCGECWSTMGSHATIEEAIAEAVERNDGWRAEGSLVLPYRVITTLYHSCLPDEDFPTMERLTTSHTPAGLKRAERNLP
jgi:hypothetical protein